MKLTRANDPLRIYLIRSGHIALPSIMAPSTGTLVYNYLSGGYGTLMFVSANPGSTDPFFQEDGIIKYGPLEVDRAVEYLTMMNQWHTEGLIYPDFLSVSTPFVTDPAPVLQDKIDIFIGGGMMDSFKALSENPEFELWPLQDAVKEGGTVHQLADIRSAATFYTAFSISTDCDNLDLCLRFMDFLYSYHAFCSIMKYR